MKGHVEGLIDVILFFKFYFVFCFILFNNSGGYVNSFLGIFSNFFMAIKLTV